MTSSLWINKQKNNFGLNAKMWPTIPYNTFTEFKEFYSSWMILKINYF